MERSQDAPLATSGEITKAVHTIVLDSSPLLLNVPPLSTLLSWSHTLVTCQSVIDEIRDAQARQRIETVYSAFLDIRSPKPDSVAIIKQFARKTGDAAVLSMTDIDLLALAYDLECERNGGNWRLRREPGQKKLNGSPPQKNAAPVEDQYLEPKDLASSDARADAQPIHSLRPTVALPQEQFVPGEQGNQPTPDDTDLSDGDWITPSNIKQHQARHEGTVKSTDTVTRMLQVATITSDFAMQNVILQMNLNLLSPNTCKRITNIKQTVLRCHGCFATTKDMSKQFCPRCGNPTLTRVTCTTDERGQVKMHLKANIQWNNKGNVFSVPKPVSGSSNQKWKGPRQGGGQHGWGNGLILAEDQKEYKRAKDASQRAAHRDLMDEDHLPNILTGSRDRGGGRIRVGAGRNVNGRKR